MHEESISSRSIITSSPPWLARQNTHCASSLRTSHHINFRIVEGAKQITYQSSPPPSAHRNRPRRHISLYISRASATTHFNLNLLRNPSTRPPTTSRRHFRYTTTSAFHPTHPPSKLPQRDTFPHGPAHKHSLDHRTSSPLDDPLVHIHTYTHARKLSQRA